MDWSIPVKLAATAAVEGYKNRHSLQGLWTRAKAFLDVGATQILVTGRSAVGKSALKDQLCGRACEWRYDLPKLSRNVEVDAITPGQWSKLIRVLPGQAGYRAQHEINYFTQGPRLEGLIHVVDYGYNCPRDLALVTSLIHNDKLNTIVKLREHNLQREVEEVIRLLADIRRLSIAGKAPKWLLIAVNKIDLYIDEMPLALANYHPEGSGKFSEVLREFQREVGNNNVAIYICPICAYEIDFTWNGTTVSSALPREGQKQLVRDFMGFIAEIGD